MTLERLRHLPGVVLGGVVGTYGVLSAAVFVLGLFGLIPAPAFWIILAPWAVFGLLELIRS